MEKIDIIEIANDKERVNRDYVSFYLNAMSIGIIKPEMNMA